MKYKSNDIIILYRLLKLAQPEFPSFSSKYPASITVTELVSLSNLSIRGNQIPAINKNCRCHVSRTSSLIRLVEVDRVVKIMSRPMLLVFLLMILIITSQFEWRQQLVGEIDTTNPRESQKQLMISKREEVVKEKIILSQEKNIQRLNELVRSLKEQLQQQCRCINETSNNSTLSSSVENVIDLEQDQIIEELEQHEIPED